MTHWIADGAQHQHNISHEKDARGEKGFLNAGSDSAVCVTWSV